MKTKKHILLLSILLISGARVLAQDSTASRSLLPDGLTIRGGIGYIAVRDEYISGERYSATLPLYGILWSKHHETYDFRLSMEYQRTQNLKEYDVSTEFSQFRIALNYLYPISEASVISKKLSISLGPTAEIFECDRRQNISGSQNSQSEVALVSGGLRSEAFWPWSTRLEVRAAAHLTLLSMGFHSINSNYSNDSRTKMLTAFNGVDADGEIGIFYSITESFGGSAGYRFNVTRVSAWDFFISANDNFIVSLSYGF